MANEHGTIRDTDPHFIIDTVTRKLRTESTKITLVQGDHNSERFTFEVPQEIEGHKMELTDKVQIHYINIDQVRKKQSPGVYEADDVTIVPAEGENPAKVTFSWLIDHTATKYQGVLNFVVRFVCMEGASVTYSWSTAIHTGIAITDGINNGQIVIEEYIDILKEWERELKANQVVSLVQTRAGAVDGGENVWTATFGDGRTSELKVKNGTRGPTGYIGSIETVTGSPLHFFVGTQEEYNALSNAQKQNLFAIITDDPTEEEIINKLQALEAALESSNENIAELLQDILSGVYTVAKATTAESATTADSATDALILKFDSRYQRAHGYVSISELKEIFGVSSIELGEYYSATITHERINSLFPTGLYVLRISYWTNYGVEVGHHFTAVGHIQSNLEGTGATAWSTFIFSDADGDRGEASLSISSTGEITLRMPPLMTLTPNASKAVNSISFQRIVAF